MAFEAVFAWMLAGMAGRRSPDVGPLGWAFFAWQVPSIVMAWMYFPIPAVVLSALVTLLIGMATWLAQRCGVAA